MKRAVFYLLAFVSVSAFSEEDRFYVPQEHELFGTLNNQCGSCYNPVLREEEDYEVIVLTSLSVPDSVWIRQSEGLRGKKACFVLRGVPYGSLSKMAHEVLELNRKGVNLPILVDSQIFERNNVDLVPVYIFREGPVHGNVSLDAAYKILRRKA